jgi:hypothetical protein
MQVLVRANMIHRDKIFARLLANIVNEVVNVVTCGLAFVGEKGLLLI